MGTQPIAQRIGGLDWDAIADSLRDQGYARTRPVLIPAECRSLAEMFTEDARFRSRVDMARYRFGEGAYAYFATPLPKLVASLRTALYPRLAPLANAMNASLGRPIRYPPTLAAYLKICHAAGQKRPTPLLLSYQAGGYNCLHQDLYGDLRFPLQVTAMLSRPGKDYEGGEFLLVENRPRQQSRGEAIVAEQGELLIFPVVERPVQGKRGMLRATMRHGVSRIRSGERQALGIIFHDAK